VAPPGADATPGLRQDYAVQDDDVAAGPAPIADAVALGHLGEALRPFTPDAVQHRLGPVGQAAHQRGDLLGVERVLGDDPVSTLTRLFLLGLPVPVAQARAALAPLALDSVPALLRRDGDAIRARLEVRPYAAAHGRDSWWVVSDFGSDVRPGPLAPDHVLGIGGASLTLAQATIRTPVARALDLGTGCGVQALHLAEHSGTVTATDLSARALRLAATTAALSGQSWRLLAGSLLEPVAGERFDLVVANPPFVVSPGLDATSGGFDYRDSGLGGDGVSRALLRDLPKQLAPGGVAQLLANWIVPADGAWRERLGGWLADGGCDAWIWQREIADPGEYVTMWLRDAGEQPGTDRWRARYDRWLDWFATAGVAAVGMGLVTLWRTDADDPVVVCEDVPQAIEQPAGTHLPAWIERARWLRAQDDATLLAAALRCADGVVRVRHDLRASGADHTGWHTELTQLRQSHGMRWELEVDDAVAAVVAACDGATPLAVPVQVLAASLGRAADEVAGALLPVVRDLVQRGFLQPPVAPGCAR
jgi:methylase of polypeptide subunit release factors